MVEQLPQIFAPIQQLDDAAYQAQLRAGVAARPHLPQQARAAVALKQRAPHQRQRAERDGHEQEHPRPRLDARDARLREAEQALRVGVGAGQLFGIEARVQQAREALTGRFKVVKESGELLGSSSAPRRVPARSRRRLYADARVPLARRG